MKKQVPKFLFFKPFLKPVIWAGENLQRHYQTSQKIGEAWLISAVYGAASVCRNKLFINQTLINIFANHPHLFGNHFVKYPNLLKIIDTSAALSVQVHPNDAYAQKHHQSLDKEEYWYVLKSDKQPFVLGHKAKSKLEAIKLIKNKQFDRLLNLQHCCANDFIYIVPGTIHAIPANTTLFEIQQSSDLTYRLYDYDRKDDEGKSRPLHIKQACDVLTNKKVCVQQISSGTLIKNPIV